MKAITYVRDLDGPHYCYECAEEIENGDRVLVDTVITERFGSGRNSRSVSKAFYHADCNDRKGVAA